MPIRPLLRDIAAPLAADPLVAGGGTPLPSPAWTMDTGLFTSLPAAVSFSRASSGTRFDATGALQTLTTNTARLDYHPVSKAARGLLIEGQRTNLLLNSATLSTQSMTVSATAYTLSFYGTGSVTLSGTSSGTLAGAGAFPARASLTFTPTAGTLTLTVSGNVQYANLEAGSFASSYIPTTGAAATREVDVAGISSLAALSFNESQGTLLLDFEYMAQAATQHLISIDKDSANFISFRRGTGAPSNLIPEILSAGSSTLNFTSPVISPLTRYKVALAYKQDDAAIAITGGGAAQTDSVVTMATGLTSLKLGRDNGGNNPMFGWIRAFAYYPTRLSNALLQTLTA